MQDMLDCVFDDAGKYVYIIINRQADTAHTTRPFLFGLCLTCDTNLDHAHFNYSRMSLIRTRWDRRVFG